MDTLLGLPVAGQITHEPAPSITSDGEATVSLTLSITLKMSLRDWRYAIKAREVINNPRTGKKKLAIANNALCELARAYDIDVTHLHKLTEAALDVLYQPLTPRVSIV